MLNGILTTGAGGGVVRRARRAGGHAGGNNLVAVNVVPVFDPLRVKELPTEGTYQARLEAHRSPVILKASECRAQLAGCTI